MHAVIKKNKARFTLLALGICFFFFLFGFSNSNESRVYDATLKKIVQNSNPGNKRLYLAQNETIKTILPKTILKHSITKKSSTKRKPSTLPSVDDIAVKVVYSSKKEKIPVPITNIEKILSIEKEFTSKGNTPHVLSQANFSFLSKKSIEKFQTTQVLPNISILNKLSKPKLFKLFDPANKKNNTRYYSLLSLSAATYVGGAIGLYSIWYSDYKTVKFHYFDDRGEWLDMDKVGHFFSAYYETKFAFQAAHWTGINRKKSLLIGAVSSTLIQGTLEIMDGLSSGWGFSKADIAMNTMGTSLFAVQELLWNEQRINMKYSSTRPNYSKKELVKGFPLSSEESRANILFGDTFSETILKDYNAQTLWLSANVYSFLPDESRFPKWINIAFGYGVENVLGAYHSNWYYGNGDKLFKGDNIFPRYRQFYLSLDLDLTKIKTKSPLLKTALFLLNSIKIPAPTLEYSQGQFKFIPMHF